MLTFPATNVFAVPVPPVPSIVGHSVEPTVFWGWDEFDW